MELSQIKKWLIATVVVEILTFYYLLQAFFIFYAIGPKIKILKTTSSFEISPVGILKVSNFLPIIKVFIYIFYSENAPKTN